MFGIILSSFTGESNRTKEEDILKLEDSEMLQDDQIVEPFWHTNIEHEEPFTRLINSQPSHAHQFPSCSVLFRSKSQHILF